MIFIINIIGILYIKIFFTDKFFIVILLTLSHMILINAFFNFFKCNLWENTKIWIHNLRKSIEYIHCCIVVFLKRFIPWPLKWWEEHIQATASTTPGRRKEGRGKPGTHSWTRATSHPLRVQRLLSEGVNRIRHPGKLLEKLQYLFICK